MIGKVLRLNPRQFGFIGVEDSVTNYFFHNRDLIDLVFDDDLLGKTVGIRSGTKRKRMGRRETLGPLEPPQQNQHDANSKANQ